MKKKTHPKKSKGKSSTEKRSKQPPKHKIDPLESEAEELLKKIRFTNGQRVMNKEFDPDEFDFHTLDTEELEFAVQWEYLREIKGGDFMIRMPREDDPLAFCKISHSKFFPIPIVRIKRESRLKIEAKEPLALKEVDPFQFFDFVNNTPPHICKHIRSVGPKDFAKKMGFTRNLDGTYGLHSFVFDWHIGRNRLKEEFKAWVDRAFDDDKKNRQGRDPSLAARNRLDQLGAWRARRAGHSYNSYLSLRCDTAEIPMPESARSFMESKALAERGKILKKRHNTSAYTTQGAFDDASFKAEEWIKSLGIEPRFIA
jgi:hypothetical protein